MKNIKYIFTVSALVTAVSLAAAPQTRLQSLDAGNVDVQAQRGKVVILAVGASWLPLSDKQAEFANMLSKRYTGKDVVVYFILTDSANPKSKNYATNELLRQWANSKKLNSSVFRDSDGTATLRKFGIDQLPSFVVLDKAGNRSGDAFGGIDPKFDITISISKRVDSLL